MRREAFELVRPKLKPKGFKIMLEALIRLLKANPEAKVEEFGIVFRNCAKASSKFNLKAAVKLLKMLFELRFEP